MGIVRAHTHFHDRVELLSSSAPLPPPWRQIGGQRHAAKGVGPSDIVVVPSSVGRAIVGQILCAGVVVINVNVGEIEVLKHFPIETAGAEQMNCQLWQRHCIGHDVHHAVTLP